MITIRLTVSPDGAISTATPLPPGEYQAAITVHDRPARQLPTHPDVEDLPTLDLGPWPEGLSLG